MSESYGDREADLGSAGNAFYNSLWEQAAAQGITVAVSSGDGGSAGCDDFNNSQTASHGIAVSGIAGTPSTSRLAAPISIKPMCGRITGIRPMTVPVALPRKTTFRKFPGAKPARSWD